MKPLIHAQISAKKYGGKIEDYMPIHNFFDQTKAMLPDMRHRAILHNSFGIFLCEQQLGCIIVNTDGVNVSTRDVGEDHILQDLGTIPTIEEWLRHMPLEGWMSGAIKKIRTWKVD